MRHLSEKAEVFGADHKPAGDAGEIGTHVAQKRKLNDE